MFFASGGARGPSACWRGNGPPRLRRIAGLRGRSATLELRHGPDSYGRQQWGICLLYTSRPKSSEYHAVLAPLSRGYPPSKGQVAHVLLTRAPCADFLYCYRKLRTRLACVKHAASVRSEPGSNSHVKLAAWKTKSPTTISGCRTPVFHANFLSLDSLNQSNGFWHISSYPVCQRTRPPVLQVGYRTTRQL